MKKSTPRFPRVSRCLLSAAIATLTATSLLTTGLHSPATAALEDSPKKVVDEVWQIVNNEFVDRNFNQSDWQKTRQELLSRNYSSHAEAYIAIRQALRSLGDPYTRFLDPREFEQLTSQTSGELSGIGIRMEIDERTQVLTVVDAIPNSPALAGGVRSGDQILAIDGRLTSLMTIEQASEAIRGATGTDISLELAREGKRFELTLTRAQIELPAVHSTLRQEGSIEVGYIKLDEFSSHAAEQMKKAIEELSGQGAEAFVLDLRGNPGGLLFASVDIARMWMQTGDIVRTIDRRGGDRRFAANRTAVTNLPLVVLVDGYSASASEILAGALKDNKRATIVGTRTYGKGTVQSVHPLSDGSGLAVTISRYYPPSGINISKQGITPDIELNLTREQQSQLAANPSLIGTNNDPLYARAINVLNSTQVRQSRQTQSNSPRQPISIR